MVGRGRWLPGFARYLWGGWGAIASLVSGLLPASAQGDAASLATAAWQAPATVTWVQP